MTDDHDLIRQSEEALESYDRAAEQGPPDFDQEDDDEAQEDGLKGEEE